MSNEPAPRSVAWKAALIALPVALIAALGVFLLLKPDGGSPQATPSASSAASPAPTTAVSMATRTLDDQQDLVCRGFIAQVPGQLNELSRRAVANGFEQNAAYGEPPVTIACGVPAVDVDPAATVYVLDGVCWVEAPAGDEHRFTTVDRAVPIEVTVPATYDPAGQWVVPLGETIISTVRSASNAPTGCSGA